MYSQGCDSAPVVLATLETETKDSMSSGVLGYSVVGWLGVLTKLGIDMIV